MHHHAADGGNSGEIVRCVRETQVAVLYWHADSMSMPVV